MQQHEALMQAGVPSSIGASTGAAAGHPVGMPAQQLALSKQGASSSSQH